MIAIEMTVAEGDWGDEAALRSLARDAIGAAAQEMQDRLADGAEVSVLFTDDLQMRQLNSRWRNKDRPTNVLSFAAQESGGAATPLLGDIVVARETLAREAGEQGKSFADHLSHLLVHGFLHLTGHDHETDDDAEEMEALERKICAALGIADPYEEH